MKMSSATGLLFATAVAMLARADVLRVVREPRQIASVTTKTESSWAKCKWCTSRISYERTYRWNVYDQRWDETTKETPDTCRKCREKIARLEKREREQAQLDLRIAEKEARKCAAEKRRQARDWTAEHR